MNFFAAPFICIFDTIGVIPEIKLCGLIYNREMPMFFLPPIENYENQLSDHLQRRVHHAALLPRCNHNFCHCWTSAPAQVSGISYRTQLYLGSDLWVRMSITERPFADLTDVTLADDDSNSIPTDDVNRANLQLMQLVANIGTNASDATWHLTGHLKNIARGTTDPGYWVWNLSLVCS